LTITVNGFSKPTHTGWRLGYGAPEAIAKAVDRIQSHSTESALLRAKGAVAALRATNRFDMHDELICGATTWRPHLQDREYHCRRRKARSTFPSTSASRFELQNFSDRLLSSQRRGHPGALGDDRTIRLSYATSIDVIKKDSIGSRISAARCRERISICHPSSARDLTYGPRH
jgi:aspartate aminotransferase